MVLVRRAEGRARTSGTPHRQLVGDGVNAGHIQGFVDGHRRQDRRQRARQERFPAPGGPIIRQLCPRQPPPPARV